MFHERPGVEPYQGKEMSDGALDLHAIQLTLMELRTQMAAHTKHTSDAIEGLTETVKDVNRRLDDVTRLQTGHEMQNQAIDRAFKAIKDLADSTKERFESTETAHQKTRDKVVWATGAAFMLSLLASSCVGLVMYYTSQLDANQQAAQAELKQTVKDNTARIGILEKYVPYPTTPRP